MTKPNNKEKIDKELATQVDANSTWESSSQDNNSNWNDKDKPKIVETQKTFDWDKK